MQQDELHKEDPQAARTKSLAEHARKASDKGLPPVHLWNPEFCGDIDIRIARNGDWYYRGSIFTRLSMVKLFSTILRKDDDDYYLVTPVEKVRIQVDDAPFTIVSMETAEENGLRIKMETNTGERLCVDKEHPLWVETDDDSGEPSPYVRVRDRLHALVSRSVFYQLVELAEPKDVDGRPCLVVESAGQAFQLGEIPLEE